MLLAVAVIWLGIEPAVAGQDNGKSSIKMVATPIVGQLTDKLRQRPIAGLTRVRIEIFRFGRKSWDRSYWAVFKADLTPAGRFAAITDFPVDSVFISEVMARGLPTGGVPTGCRIIDESSSSSIRFDDGVMLRLTQLGPQPWRNGAAAVITGHPDADGYFLGRMILPEDDITRANFRALANSRGR